MWFELGAVVTFDDPTYVVDRDPVPRPWIVVSVSPSGLHGLAHDVEDEPVRWIASRHLRRAAPHVASLKWVDA